MEMQHAMDDMAALTEDVLLQIFSRVGSVKDLFKFAVTCRRWLRRFTDPAFLRGLCPGNGEGHRTRLLGFFFQQTRFYRCEKMIRMRVTQQSSVCVPTFVPAPGSPLGLTDRTLTSFLATDDDTFNYAEPLAARCGHVLMRLVPRTERMIASSHLLGLCNPITGERHVLPPLELTGLHRCLTSYAIITSADSDLDGKQRPSSSSSARCTFSQLLLTVQHKEDCNEYLYSYSTAMRTWSAPTMCVDGRCFSLVGERSAVVHQGAAHWLFIDRVSSATQDDILYKLSVEVGTVRMSLTKLPLGAGGSPLLCVSRDGKLSVACVFPIHVRVWTQQDDTPATWLRTVIRIPMAVPYPNYSQICQPREKWFDFNRGSMLVLYRSNGVFILDLEKKVMEKVMDCLLPLYSDKLNRTSVAYEMDLVEFFVLQLGGLCRGSTG